MDHQSVSAAAAVAEGIKNREGGRAMGRKSTKRDKDNSRGKKSQQPIAMVYFSLL